jgi:uncharacterized delta-60 repeat protein
VVGTGYVADSAWGLSVYSDGRLLVSGAQKRSGGTDSDFAVVRLSADGVRDAAFGTNGVATVDVNNRNASPRTTTLLPDGGIVMAGYMDDGGVVKPVLFKLTSAGALDPTFGTAGIFAPTVLAAVTEAYGAVLQGTSFVTAGYGRNSASENLDWLSLRVSSTGALDTTWGTAGVARLDLAMFNDNARALVALPDNRVLLVGGGRPAAEATSTGCSRCSTAPARPTPPSAHGASAPTTSAGAVGLLLGRRAQPRAHSRRARRRPRRHGPSGRRRRERRQRRRGGLPAPALISDQARSRTPTSRARPSSSALGATAV